MSPPKSAIAMVAILALAGLSASSMAARNRSRRAKTLGQEVAIHRNRNIQRNLDKYVHKDLHQTAIELLRLFPNTGHDKALCIRAHAGPKADEFGPDAAVTAVTFLQYETSLREYLKQYVDQ